MQKKSHYPFSLLIVPESSFNIRYDLFRGGWLESFIVAAEWMESDDIDRVEHSLLTLRRVLRCTATSQKVSLYACP